MRLFSLVVATLAALTACEAKRFRLIKRRYNTRTTYFLADADADPTARSVLHVGSNDTYEFLLEVKNGRAASIVGMRDTTHEYIVGPVGCAGNGIETSNCAENSVEATNNYIKLNECWYLSPRSDECVLKGCGDHDCLGALHVTGDEVKTTDITAEDLFFSTYRYLKGNFLVNCGAPGVVEVDMKLPEMIATTDCADYAGRYANTNHDAYSGYLVNVTYAYAKSDGAKIFHRVLVRRYQTETGNEFRILLADATGLGILDTFYTVYATSTAAFATKRIPFGIPISFNYGTGTCTATFSLDATGVFPPQLNPPERLSEVNFYLNKENPSLYTSRACGFIGGGYTSDLTLKVPGCPDGALCFGQIDFKVETSPGVFLPIFVPRDPAWDAYSLDCVHIYPFAPTFYGFLAVGGDGALYNRMEADQERCQAPFLRPDLIVGNTFVDEKARQCKLLGADVCGLAQDRCCRKLAYADCIPGFFGFGENCYYKFDPVREKYAFTRDDEASKICAGVNAELGNKVVPVSSVNGDEDAWMKLYYPFLERNKVEGYPTRVPKLGGNCDFIDIKLNDPNDPFDDERKVTRNNCHHLAFPLCKYAKKDKEIVGQFQSISARNVATLKNGQYGGPWTGHELRCQCFPGFCMSETGDCMQRCCPPPTSELSSNTIVVFDQKCRANDRGFCEDGDANWCQCRPNYGPDANILSNLIPQIVDIPCALPCSYTGERYWSYGNDTFASSLLKKACVPCGGVSFGVGTVDSTTNTGECACTKRKRISNDQFAGTEEFMMNGKGCTCRNPRLGGEPYLFRTVVQSYCNAKGTCCPFGETVADPLGIDNDDACAGVDSGCACDNGVTGEACTCDAPFDVAFGAINNVASTKIVVDLGNPRFVTDVVIKKKATLFAASLTNSSVDCVPVAVHLSKNSDRKDFECAYSEAGQRPHWNCSTTDAYRFIVVTVPETTRNCLIQAYEEWFPPCGVFGNPYSGRFSANTDNRGWQKYLELQKMEYASNGCTNR